MKFVYPITKENGEEFETAGEFEGALKRELAGQYGFNPGNSSWHGGLHFSLNNAPHVKEDYPVRAIADGNIVACRVHSEYQKSTFQLLDLEYSNDFCLIEHTYRYEENNSQKTFAFYSLYMHLAPLCEPHLAEVIPSGLPNWLYKPGIRGTSIRRGLYGRAEPVVDSDNVIHAGAPMCTIPVGTVFIYDSRQVKTQFINGTPHSMARCRFASPIAHLGSTIREAWVCIESHFVEVDDRQLRISTGQLIDLNSSDTVIKVKAGDEIGYLGKFEIPKNIETDLPRSETRYQIHFELFAKEQPPTAFLKQFFNESDRSGASFQVIEGQGSEGFLDEDEPNGFFKDLASAMTLDQKDIPGTEMVKNLTPWNNCKNIITHHSSEWYSKASEKTFLDTLVDKYNHSNFTDLIEHEKQRIDNLIWMQETKSLGFTQDVWNWWPIQGAQPLIVEYSEAPVDLAVMSLAEAAEFATNLWQEQNGKNTLDNAKKVWDLADASKDAYQLAKGLGGMGVVAYTKSVHGKEYVIIKGYKQHLKTLAKGNRWLANNPQVVQLGLGTKNMARNMMKMGLVVDIIFSVAINAVDVIVHDEKTMVDFVGSSGADIVKGLMATGVGTLAAIGVASIGLPLIAAGLAFAFVGFIVSRELDKQDDHYGASDKLVEILKGAAP